MKPHWLVVLSAMFMVTGVEPAARLSSGESAGVTATEFSSQTRERPRIRVTPNQPAAYDYPRPDDYSWPGPGAKRYCVDWYATEYRPSGTVITPQMRCRWVRG